MTPTLESIVTILGTVLGSTALMRLMDIILYRREERRARNAAASKGEAEVDMLRLQGVGAQYDALLRRYNDDIARCSDRVMQMEKIVEAERSERDARNAEREKETADMRNRMYNMELILLDLAYGVKSLSDQMQEVGIAPRWRPMIKPDQILRDLQYPVPDSFGKKE